MRNATQVLGTLGAVVAGLVLLRLLLHRAGRRVRRTPAGQVLAVAFTAHRLLVRTGAYRRLWLFGGAALGRPAGREAWRLRRELDAAGAGADLALDAALVAGAPVGALPELLGRIRTSSRAVDRQLAVCARHGGGVPAGLRSHARELAGAARSVQQAAADSASTFLRSDGLSADVRREVLALRSGVRHV